MDVVIAGGHGKIALLLARLLTERGDRVRSLVRNPDHAADVRAAGADPVVFDLEGSDPLMVAGADAVVFAAGAGPGSGAARKRTVDRDGALKLADAAVAAGVPHYVMVSAMGATLRPSSGDEVFDAYLVAKAEADAAVLARVDATILRPGHLTDDAGTGSVQLSATAPEGRVPRADVAAVVAAVLRDPPPAGTVVELVGGPTPIADAVRALRR